MRRRSDRARPLILGPDRDGKSCVIAGDRVCFFGSGPIPQTPGALRLGAQDARIVPGTAAVVAWAADDPVMRAQDLLLAGVTSVVATVSLADHIVPVAADLCRAGLRVVVTASGSQDLVAPFLANNRNLVRFVGALGGAGNGGGGFSADLVGLPFLDLSAAPVDVVARSFGRRLRTLEPGSAGDVVVAGDSGPLHVVVAGRVRVRDGVMVGSMTPRAPRRRGTEVDPSSPG